MKLVLFNEYRLGVIQGNRVVDAMEALQGLQFRKPQDLIEEVITRWGELKPKIDSAVRGKEGVPLDSVRLRPPVPKPATLLCAAVNYLEFGPREPAVLDAFLTSPSSAAATPASCLRCRPLSSIMSRS